MQTTLTIQQQRVIERLLSNRPKSIKANKTLIYFAEQGYGTLSGNTIYYTAQDFTNFEQLISNSYLGDNKLSADEFSKLGNRNEVAKYRIDEKSNHTSVFGQHILVVGMGCDIPLCVTDNTNLTQAMDKTPTMPATPIGVLPTILPEYLDARRMHKLIIVENGQPMTHWWQWRKNLPTDWQNAVLLYRGHGDNISKLLTWLTTLSAQCEVLLCFDMDLSGLKMMSEYSRHLKQTGCQVSVLLPTMLMDDAQNHRAILGCPAYNQPEKISLQLAKVRSASILPILQPIYQTLITHNIALMQEHILQDKNIQWSVVKING